ncbi:hypothetical protein IIA15_10480 [candidate division TA06 bacterium]|nr:hypothetical protein [candidate division TA06 bacterium]
MNNGIGPAVVVRVTVSVKGRQLDSRNPIQDLGNALNSISGEGATEWIALGALAAGVAFQAGGSIRDLEVRENVQTPENFERFLRILEHFNIKLEYQSIYQENTRFVELNPDGTV